MQIIFSLCIVSRFSFQRYLGCISCLGCFQWAVWPSLQLFDIVGLFGQFQLKQTRFPHPKHLVFNMSHGLRSIFYSLFIFTLPNSMGKGPVLLDTGRSYVILLCGQLLCCCTKWFWCCMGFRCSLISKAIVATSMRVLGSLSFKSDFSHSFNPHANICSNSLLFASDIWRAIDSKAFM